MTDSPWGRPITGEPIDYVPIDAPATAITPTIFTAPILRRALVAALIAALLVSGFAFPAFGAGIIAISAMVAVIWGADKLADYLNEKEGVTTTANGPDPFSWWVTLVALALILGVILII
jgi:hypothetical protein